MTYENLPLFNNTTASRFEMEVEGHHAFIEYLQKGDHVYLVHTQVPEALEGRGIAAALVEKTLDFIEGQHLQFVALCSYVKHFLTRHPEWKRLELV